MLFHDIMTPPNKDSFLSSQEDSGLGLCWGHHLSDHHNGLPPGVMLWGWRFFAHQEPHGETRTTLLEHRFFWFCSFSWLSLEPVVWSWVSHLICLGFNLLACEMELMNQSQCFLIISFLWGKKKKQFLTISSKDVSWRITCCNLQCKSNSYLNNFFKRVVTFCFFSFNILPI